MLGINHRLFVSDDRIHVLKENNPRHDRVRKTGLGSFFVVLSKISGRVKKLFGHDGRLEAHVSSRIADGLSANPGRMIPFVLRVPESSPCSLQTGIATLKQGQHVRWHDRIRQPRKCSLVAHVAQIEGIGRI